MLHFKLVRWKNFLSTGKQFTEIKLDKSPTTLIVGDNGSGKSTLTDALCFALYGKPFRKIKKDQLINSINNKECVSEVEFSINGSDYLVSRGIKPNYLEIYKNGILLNQDAASKDYQGFLESTILKMSHKIFCQIVILGSSLFVPFMQLPAALRREINEDLLDITVFSRMNFLLKSKMGDYKLDISLIEKDIESMQDKISIMEENMKKNKKLAESNIGEINEKIAILEKTIAEHWALHRKLEKEVKSLEISISHENERRAAYDEISITCTSLQNRLENVSTGIKFLQQNSTCPTCKQEITEENKKKHIHQKEQNVDQIIAAIEELNKRQRAIEDELSDISEIKVTIRAKREQYSKAEASAKSDTRIMALLHQQIREIESQQNKMDLNNEIDDLRTKLVALVEKKAELLKLKNIYDISHLILKDNGIKSKIIKQYIPVINALVNKYLAAMDFFVKFELDEKFEEKILSRHRDDFSYASFSEGEKMRIDLALLFTWRAIAKMKNSAKTNLLILDEVFDASLDGNGCDEFMKLIQNLEHTNVFVISHKGDIILDKFRSSIRFEKVNNFSKMVIQ